MNAAPTQTKRDAAREAFAAILAKKPADAVALIVAEQREDRSELQSDYHGSVSLRVVAIGWRTGKREDFKQLRRAAATFKETEHLGPDRDIFRTVAKWQKDQPERGEYAGRYCASVHGIHGQEFSTEGEAAAAIAASTAVLPDDVAWEVDRTSIEHRENYSMGAGNYLKAGSRDDSGWSVRSERLEWDGYTVIEDGLDCACNVVAKGPEAVNPCGVCAADASAVSELYAISKHYHTKGAFDMWLVVPSGRLGSERFGAALASCQLAGGWYSRKWAKTPGGFAFKDEGKAAAWAAAEFGGAPGPEATPTDSDEVKPQKPATKGNPDKAARFRELADGLTAKIEQLRGPRLENTPKRQYQGMAARCDASNLERVQRALRALAEGWDAGTLRVAFQDLRTKAQIEPMVTRIIDHPSYYCASESDRWRDDSALAKDLRAYVEEVEAGKHDEDDAAAAKRAKIKKLEEDIRFVPIAGFFPTPPDVIAKMLDAADIRPGMWVLEPSAGKGDIADAIAASCKVCADQFDIKPDEIRLTCLEVVSRLAHLCREKGHDCITTDFLETSDDHAWDRVLMNPPFENGQAIKHVRKAYEALKPGGRLVAIMPSVFNLSRLTQSRQPAHDWLDEVGAEFHELDPDAFKGAFRSTGVSTVMVVIERAEA